MELDLAPVQALFNSLMADECVISRLSDLPDDDWDSNTGTYVPAAKTPVTLYSGVCFLATLSPIPSTQVEGGQEQANTEYNLFVPVDTPGEFKYLDEVVLTVSDLNPELIGVPLDFITENFGTYKAGRWFSVRRKEARA